MKITNVVTIKMTTGQNKARKNIEKISSISTDILLKIKYAKAPTTKTTAKIK